MKIYILIWNLYSVNYCSVFSHVKMLFIRMCYDLHVIVLSVALWKSFYDLVSCTLLPFWKWWTYVYHIESFKFVISDTPQNTLSNKKTHLQYLIRLLHTYVCNQWIFVGLQLVWNKIFLKKRLIRFIACKITLYLLHPNHSTRTGSLKAQSKALFWRFRS